MCNKSDEYVVLLNEKLEPIGEAEKYSIHHQETPLHLAFSCYITNDKGEVLITRRSLKKVAWPGVWTNSVCGHPMQGEELIDAVKRRAGFELGLSHLDNIRLKLEAFQYCERDASGIVENEFCPVFKAETNSEPQVNPDEVMDYKWVKIDDLYRSVQSTPWAFSPWMVKQLEQLDQLSEK